MLSRSARDRDLDRVSARVLDTPGTATRLDAYRIDATFHIDIYLPGTEPARLEIGLDHEALTIRAERGPVVDDGWPVQDAEPPAGSPRCEVFVPDTLDTDRLEARCADGVVQLSIPVADRDGAALVA